MSDAQIPQPGQIFLDHVGWFLPDLALAANTFAPLGFPLTPVAIHRDRDPDTGAAKLIGSSNRLAMLGRGYLEFLTPVPGPEADTPVRRHMEACLARRTGVHLIAFTVADAEAEAARLESVGFEPMPTVHLRRMAPAGEGREVEVAFTVVRARLGAVPEGRLQTLTHLTPELMWRPELVAEINGIKALEAAVLASAEPEASAGRLSRYVGRPAQPVGEGWRIDLDRGALEVLAPDAAAARYGVTLAPGDPPAVAAVAFRGDPERFAAKAAEAGLAAGRGPGGAAILSADQALGAAFEVRAT